MSNSFIQIGIIQSAFQLDGGLKVKVTTDFPGRFKTGGKVFVAFGSFNKECRIQNFFILKGKSAVIHLEHVNSREDAEKYAGCEILIPETEAYEFSENLEEGSFLYCDIIGCSVFKDGSAWGEVVDLYEGGGGLNLVLSHNKKEYEIPFVDEMVDTTHIAEKRIDVNPIEGLFDD